MIAREWSLTLFYIVSVNIITTHRTSLACFNNLIFYLLTEQWKLIMCKHLSRILELFVDYICTQEQLTTHQHTQDFIDNTKIALGNHSWSIQNFGAGEGTLNSTEIGLLDSRVWDWTLIIDNMLTQATLNEFKYLILDMNQFPMEYFGRIRFVTQFCMQNNSFPSLFRKEISRSSNSVLQTPCPSTLINLILFIHYGLDRDERLLI